MKINVHNLNVKNDKLVFDTNEFTPGCKVYHSEYNKFLDVVNCTDDTLTLKADYGEVTVSITEYVKEAVLGVSNDASVEKIVRRFGPDVDEATITKRLRSKRLILMLVNDEGIDIKSNITVKISPDLEGEPLIFIDNNDEANIINCFGEDGISFETVAYVDSPDNYELVGDIDEVECFDRSYYVKAYDIKTKFKRIVKFDAKTLSCTDFDIDKYLKPAPAFDHDKIAQIKSFPVIAFDDSGNIYTVIYDIDQCFYYCPHKENSKYFDKFYVVEGTTVPVDFDIVLNTVC